MHQKFNELTFHQPEFILWVTAKQLTGMVQAEHVFQRVWLAVLSERRTINRLKALANLTIFIQLFIHPPFHPASYFLPLIWSQASPKICPGVSPSRPGHTPQLRSILIRYTNHLIRLPSKDRGGQRFSPCCWGWAQRPVRVSSQS